MSQQTYDAKEASVVERENLGGNRLHRKRRQPGEPAAQVVATSMIAAHHKGKRRPPMPTGKGRFGKR